MGRSIELGTRPLGRTKLEVSSLSLGTAEFGMNYGIGQHYGPPPPSHDEVIYLLQYAADRGINLFDTAPAYGESEELLGGALGHNHDCYFATKVSMLQEKILNSLEISLRALKRDCLDIVHIHSATSAILRQGGITEILLKAKDSGKVRFIGASIYTEEAAQFVIESGDFDVLQLPYSILDQRMAERILPMAFQANVGVICRSALLKGVLTERAKELPSEVDALRKHAIKVMRTLTGNWQELPQIALRFCDAPYIDTILVGVSNQKELDSALEAISFGWLSQDKLKLAYGLALKDERLMNPTNWH